MYGVVGYCIVRYFVLYTDDVRKIVRVTFLKIVALKTQCVDIISVSFTVPSKRQLSSQNSLVMTDVKREKKIYFELISIFSNRNTSGFKVYLNCRVPSFHKNTGMLIWPNFVHLKNETI